MRKFLLAALLLVGGVMLYFELRNTFAAPAGTAVDLIYVDSATGGTFRHTPKLGEPVPVISPLTGRATGYPTVLCYWNKDGTVKSDPTPVLMNSFVGKKEPTFCPDCGRLVTWDSSVPAPGAKPPPTMAEWVAQGKKVPPPPQHDGRQ